MLRLNDHHAVTLFAALFLLLWMLYGVPLQNLAYDPSFYYAHVRSPVIDGDLDFSNEGQPPELLRLRTPTGLVASLWSCGPAIAWLPFFLLAHLLSLTNGAPADGYSPLYLTLASLGSATWGLGGVLACYALARRFTLPAPAAVATIAFWLASPFFFFMYRIPLYAHAPTVTLVACTMLTWHYARERQESYWIWFLLGLLIGAAALMRWQNGLYILAVPFALRRSHFRDVILRFSLVATGAVIGFAPQMAVWWRLYGQLFAIPQGNDFLQWLNPVVRLLLFGSNRGLFVWQPITFFGVVGLLLIARRNRTWTFAFGMVMIAEVYLNSVVRDWWGGGGYGPRRFDCLIPPLTVGAAVFFESVWRHLSARITALALCTVAVLHQLGLAQAYYYRVLPDARPFPIVEYDTGQPLPWQLFADIFLGTVGRPAFLVDIGPSFWSATAPLFPGVIHGVLSGDHLIASIVASLTALVIAGTTSWFGSFLLDGRRQLARVPRFLALGIVIVSICVTTTFLLVGS